MAGPREYDDDTNIITFMCRFTGHYKHNDVLLQLTTSRITKVRYYKMCQANYNSRQV